MNPAHQGFAFPPLTPAIKRLILANVAVFLLNAVALGIWPPDGFTEWAALSGTGMFDGWGLGALRLLSYQFVHSPYGLGHLFFNMLTLYFLGGMAETYIGYRGTYKLYLVGGLVGGLVHILMSIALERPDQGVIGASGACYALLVYAACRRPDAMIIFIVFPIPLKYLAIALVAWGAYDSYLELVLGPASSVSHGAHLGGALAGWIVYKQGWFVDHTPFGYQEGLLAGWRRRVQAMGAQRRAKRRQVLQETLDGLLEKVHTQGMSALTPAERKFLERASKELQGRD